VYLNNSRRLPRHAYAFMVHTTCNAGSSGLHHELHVRVVDEALPRSTRWTREGHPTLRSHVGSGVEEGSKQASEAVKTHKIHHNRLFAISHRNVIVEGGERKPRPPKQKTWLKHLLVQESSSASVVSYMYQSIPSKEGPTSHPVDQPSIDHASARHPNMFSLKLNIILGNRS